MTARTFSWGQVQAAIRRGKANGMLQSHRYCIAFSALLRDHWSEIRAFTTTEHFDRDGVIFSVGDPADAMHLIETGRVKVSQMSVGGDENIVGIYQKGDLVGEICICKRGARENQAVALETVTVVSFRVNELLRILQSKPAMVLELLMFFCARFVECQEQIVSLAFDEVRVRLAKEMLHLCALTEGQSKSGAIQLPVRLTHQELAGLVKTTRENVSKIMNELRSDGLLDYDREGIIIFPDKLESYLKKFHK